MSAQSPRDNQKKMLEQAYGLRSSSSPSPSVRPKRVEPRQYRPIAKPTRSKPMPTVDHPQLRLVGVGPDDDVAASKPASREQPMLGPADPRWVLAVRASEHLQGTILTPEARERLMKVGHVLGLSPFDTSLIIAMVQDQARRGRRPSECATASEPQLRMIPLPRATSITASFKNLTGWQVAMILAALIATELLVLNWVF